MLFTIFLKHTVNDGSRRYPLLNVLLLRTCSNKHVILPFPHPSLALHCKYRKTRTPTCGPSPLMVWPSRTRRLPWDPRGHDPSYFKAFDLGLLPHSSSFCSWLQFGSKRLPGGTQSRSEHPWSPSLASPPVTLNGTGLNYAGPLICGFFFNKSSTVLYC